MKGFFVGADLVSARGSTNSKYCVGRVAGGHKVRPYAMGTSCLNLTPMRSRPTHIPSCCMKQDTGTVTSSPTIIAASVLPHGHDGTGMTTRSTRKKISREHKKQEIGIRPAIGLAGAAFSAGKR